MGTFDISRVNFDAKKHYKSVRMQEGRVLIDDDWNENERIDNEDERQSRADIIGPYGSPDDGFRITPPPTGLISGTSIDFTIKAGTLYLGGLRLELDTNETYRLQKDWLQQPDDLDPVPAVVDATGRYDLVYLEAWQQGVTAVEDGSLFEAALGGPDTTGRVRNMRRVRLASAIGFCDCADAWNKFIINAGADPKSDLKGDIVDFELIPDTKLQVTFNDTGLPEDLCTPSVAGGYLGAENQAIRVQLIDSSTFTWGFDNASPLYKVTVDEDGKTVHMVITPKDQYHWPLTNQVVEILPWSAVLSNGEKVAEQSGHLSKVDASYDPDNRIFTLLTKLPAVPSPPHSFGLEWENRTDAADLKNQDPAVYFYMRVWNRGSDLASDPAVKFTAGTAVNLGNTGLAVTITGTDLNATDFWIIAARPETPNRVVPWSLETGVPSFGVRRFLAPLAVISWRIDASGKITGQIVHDCRRKFNPLTADDCCCTYTVGDGKESHGDFNSIQEAVEALPERGGKICVLAGEHNACVIISNRRQIQINGCGDQTIIYPDSQTPDSPIFIIENSQKIQLENMTLYAIDGIAIVVADVEDATIFSDNIRINNNRIIALVNAINIQAVNNRTNDNNIFIVYNTIGILDDDRGQVAIFSLADKVLIERNRIVVIPPIKRDDPNNPNNPGGGGDPFNPCRKVGETGISVRYWIYLLLKYVYLFNPTAKKIGYKAMGGIQIGSTSERVMILQNEIIGGKGYGVLLGHHVIPPPEPVKLAKSAKQIENHINAALQYYSPMYEISIEENLIQQMGTSGISALDIKIIKDNQQQEFTVYINDLTIYRNRIMGCSTQLDAKSTTTLAFGGIILDYLEYSRILENRIEKNGDDIQVPICGVFIKYGERIDISNNNIIENGFSGRTSNSVIQKGTRGGIVLQMVFKAAAIVNSRPSFDGIPTLKVHDNIVVQPLGHSLYAMVKGPVSVEGNQFTTLGTDKTNVLSHIAVTVLILNLGISKDLLAIALRNVANLNGASYTTDAKAPDPSAFDYLPNGKVMFTGNQTTLDLRDPLNSDFGLSSQLIMSLDDVGFSGNQSECAGFFSLDPQSTGGVTLDIVLINTILFAVSVRANDNRFTDGLALTFYSLMSYGYMNTAIGNQATHCLIVLGNMVNKWNLILISNLCKDDNEVFRITLGAPVAKDGQ
jgi:hypothetical protein